MRNTCPMSELSQYYGLNDSCRSGLELENVLLERGEITLCLTSLVIFENSRLRLSIMPRAFPSEKWACVSILRLPIYQRWNNKIAFFKGVEIYNVLNLPVRILLFRNVYYISLILYDAFFVPLMSHHSSSTVSRFWHYMLNFVI